MPLLQTTVQLLRGFLPRGWSPLLMSAARLAYPLRRYEVLLADGDRLTVDLSNRMSYQYFYYGALPNEAVTATLFRRFLTAGSVLVDVGANIGYYTRLGARLVGPAGTVVALEPDPRTFDLLRTNVAAFTNVETHRVAAADRCGEALLHVHASRDQSSLLPVPHTTTLAVPLTTLDRVARHLSRCDLIKMDIEGGELPALRGAVGLIERCRPVVYFEFAPETTRSFGGALSSFLEFFAQFGQHRYTLYRANLPHTPLVPLDAGAACDYVAALPHGVSVTAP